MRPPVASARLAALDLGRVTAAARAAAGALERRYRLVLGVLLGVQWLGALWIALKATHSGWLYHHGGDGTWYWTAAWELGHFRLPYTAIGYGYSYLLAPFGAIFGPSMLDGLPPAILLNTLVLLPLALLLLYGVAERIAGRLFGLLTAALWVVLPLLAYRGFRPGDARPGFLHVFLPGSSGLNMLGDYPSVVACLASAYFGARALDSRNRSDALLCGLLAGFAVGVKPANALFLAAPVVGFVAARRFGHVVLYGAGLVLPLVALALWKQRGLGTLPILDATGAPVRLAAGAAPLGLSLSRFGGIDFGALHDHMQQLREIFWSKTLVEWTAFAGSFALLARSFAKGALVVCWFWPFILVKGSSSFASVYSMTFFRLVEPAWPAFVLLVAGLALLLPRVRAIAPATPASVPRWFTVGAVVVLGILPIALIGLARPAAADSTARGLGGGVEVVTLRFDLHATATADGVALRWNGHHGGRDLSYRILRFTNEDGVCISPGPGTPECYMDPVATFNTSRTSFVDRPGKGEWSYRIAVTASQTGDAATGDPLLLSEPVTVTVR